MKVSRLILGVILSLALLVPPVVVEAQPPARVHRLGFLGSAAPSGYAHLVDALRQGLSDLGYVEGKNLVIEYRWADGKYDRLPDLARQLVRQRVDLIVTHGTPGSLAAKQATTTIPIVMAISGDAVATGLVASIARPGGNVTGSTFFFPELNAKRVELLKETLPGATRIATFGNADNPSVVHALKEMEPMARALKVDLEVVQVRRPDEFAHTFSAMAKRRVEGIVLIDDALLTASVQQLADLAAKTRIPTIGGREYANAGGLMAYAVNFPVIWRRAAVFVDKILKGAKPADLPVEQATTFEFVINLPTARALGLTIPPAVLARADEVIR
jgi:putative ABC transport system substrate-binding protein